jgi:hypothetical protein
MPQLFGDRSSVMPVRNPFEAQAGWFMRIRVVKSGFVEGIEEINNIFIVERSVERYSEP